MGAPASVRRVVPAGQSASVFTLPADSTIHVQPGAGGTMTCQVRVHPDDPLTNIQAGTASYNAATVIFLPGPVHEVQFAAAVADGAGSVAY